MLNNIKSSYFFQILFSYVDESQKLKIIIHNKDLQNKINISLFNYKIFSGKYIIFEENNKNIKKIYNSLSDQIIVRVEHLNGKVKEYDCFGSLIFEGEYLNGKRNGKGKEYNHYGKLVFEGEYLNGKRWNGKLYDEDNDFLIYELKDGKGYVKEHLLKGRSYEGEYLNGEKNGMGEEYYFSLIYKGEYLNGKRNGKGKEYFGRYLIFDGEYLNGKRWNGKLYTNDNNISYEIKNGKGILIIDFYLKVNI